jgi:hypothetical protein
LSQEPRAKNQESRAKNQEPRLIYREVFVSVLSGSLHAWVHEDSALRDAVELQEVATQSPASKSGRSPVGEGRF